MRGKKSNMKRKTEWEKKAFKDPCKGKKMLNWPNKKEEKKGCKQEKKN
jgi:hypothetical protein